MEKEDFSEFLSRIQSATNEARDFVIRPYDDLSLQDITVMQVLRKTDYYYWNLAETTILLEAKRFMMNDKPVIELTTTDFCNTMDWDGDKDGTGHLGMEVVKSYFRPTDINPAWSYLKFEKLPARVVLFRKPGKSEEVGDLYFVTLLEAKAYLAKISPWNGITYVSGAAGVLSINFSLLGNEK